MVHTSFGDIAYRIDGKGRPLLLIMGLSGSMDAWEPSFVNALAENHEVIMFDNAGVGLTQNPFGDSLNMSDMADQTAALLSALKIRKTDVLGWSMGGMIAQALAVLHPDLVDHLVLCATLPGNGKAVAPAPSALSNLEAALFPPSMPQLLANYLSQISTYPHFYLASAATIADQRHAILVWFAGLDPAGKRIGQIKAPTLVADGSEDPLIPLANDEELARVIPHARLKIFEGGAHGFLFQFEDQFLSLISSFLKAG